MTPTVDAAALAKVLNDTLGAHVTAYNTGANPDQRAVNLLAVHTTALNAHAVTIGALEQSQKNISNQLSSLDGSAENLEKGNQRTLCCVGLIAFICGYLCGKGKRL